MIEEESRKKDLDPCHVHWDEISAGKFLISSTALCFVDVGIFYPFDLLKTREHVDRSSMQGKTPWHITWLQVKEATRGGKNLRGLYKGFWTNYVGNVPCYMIYLGAYSWGKHQLGWDPESDSWFRSFGAPLLAGGFADLASLGLYVPIEVLTKRLQVKDSPFTNGWQVARCVIQEQGVRGLYAGSGATLVQSGLGSATWWSVYESSKASLIRSYRQNNNGAANDLTCRFLQSLSGGLASAVSCTVVNPFDVVKSRLQTQAAEANVTKYRHFFHGFQVILKEEGWRSFSRGLLPKIVSRAPLGAITSTFYELMFYYSRT